VAAQAKRHIEVAEEVLAHVSNAGRAVDHESVNVWTAEADRVCAEGYRFVRLSTPSDAAVEEDRSAAIVVWDMTCIVASGHYTTPYRPSCTADDLLSLDWVELSDSSVYSQMHNILEAI
jgi:hypothetical protein